MDFAVTSTFVPFGGSQYWPMLLALVFGRGVDALSAHIATPNLVLEGNPIAKRLGWRWYLPVNAIFCVILAACPSAAIMVSTMSVLIAARNFQAAWLMRSLGEEAYREWHVKHILKTALALYLSCLAGEIFSVAAVGAVIIFFGDSLVLLSVGWGIVGYGFAIAYFVLLARWRLGRVASRNAPDASAETAALVSVGLPEVRNQK
jgi:hypothetical protein